MNHRSANGLTPLLAMCGVGAPPGVLEKLLELKAELNPHEAPVVTPLAYLAMFYCQNPWGAENLQVLLAGRADLDQQCKPCPPKKRCFAWREVSTTPFELLSRLGTTPLGVASYFGHEDLVEELLKMKADTEVRNFDGLRALELARHQVKDILQSPPSDSDKIFTLHLPGYDTLDGQDASFVACHFNDEMVDMKFQRCSRLSHPNMPGKSNYSTFDAGKEGKRALTFSCLFEEQHLTGLLHSRSARIWAKICALCTIT